MQWKHNIKLHKDAIGGCPCE